MADPFTSHRACPGASRPRPPEVRALRQHPLSVAALLLVVWCLGQLRTAVNTNWSKCRSCLHTSCRKYRAFSTPPRLPRLRALGAPRPPTHPLSTAAFVVVRIPGHRTACGRRRAPRPRRGRSRWRGPADAELLPKYSLCSSSLAYLVRLNSAVAVILPEAWRRVCNVIRDGAAENASAEAGTAPRKTPPRKPPPPPLGAERMQRHSSLCGHGFFKGVKRSAAKKKTKHWLV